MDMDGRKLIDGSFLCTKTLAGIIIMHADKRGAYDAGGQWCPLPCMNSWGGLATKLLFYVWCSQLFYWDEAVVSHDPYEPKLSARCMRANMVEFAKWVWSNGKFDQNLEIEWKWKHCDVTCNQLCLCLLQTKSTFSTQSSSCSCWNIRQWHMTL
jgi:hypothetical protein